MVSLGECDAERIGVRNGIACFHMGRFEHEKAIGGHNPERQLVNNANGALGLMESLFAFDDVQALTVGDKRQEDHSLFPAGRAKNLAHLLSRGLTIQISEQGPRVEHDDPTSWSCHAGVLPSASASNASAAIARAC